MNIFGIGTGELILILLIALLVLGPERLPEIVRLWGRFIRTTRKFRETWYTLNAQINAQVEREVAAAEKAKAKPAPKPSPASSDVDADLAERTIAPPVPQDKPPADHPDSLDPA